MPSFRRLVSPQTVTELSAKRHRGLLGRLMSLFGSETTPIQAPPKNNDFSSELRLIEQEPLPQVIKSSKKLSISIAEPRESVSEATPRTQTLENNLGVYQRYFDTIKTAHEDEGNDLERRLSTVYEGPTSLRRSSIYDKHQALNPPPDIARERNTSPMLDLVKQNLGTENSNTVHDNMPLIIEHEFAPLYRDDEGNLVRPPFINLDPRERYHLLQLKRSIEASESLQSRIKYMVDPNETKSAIIPGNMVETSTQTHDGDYLDKTLNFVKYRKVSHTKKRLLQTTRPKNARGFFSGEFLYDVEDIADEDTKNKLDGYLGLVGKPSFSKSDATGKLKTTMKTSPDEDTLLNKLNKFSSNGGKSVDDRYGLNNVLINGEKPDMTLDSDFVDLKERISNIIKLNDHKNDKKVESKDHIPPSSGFKFEINKNEIESILEKRKDAEKPSLLPGSNKTTSDGASSKPMFSFGNKASILSNEQNSSDRDTSETSGKRKLLIGENDTAAETQKTGRSFNASAPSAGSEPKLSFSFGGNANKVMLKTEAKLPLFGSEKATEKPLFTFAKEKKDETQTDLFDSKKRAHVEEAKTLQGSSLGDSKKQTSPLFSFGSSGKEMDPSKPSFSFGQKTKEGKTSSSLIEQQPKEAEKPSFSFGEGPKEAKKPSLSFAAKHTEADKPALTFGEKPKGVEKPTFSFGGSTINPEKSSFSFGKPAEKETTANTSALFGSSDNKKSTPEPSVTFGATGATNASTPAFQFGEGEKPPFSFGLKKEERPASSEDKSDKPAFNFGEKKDDKPLFSFGSGNKENSPTTEKAETPQPVFGTKESTPAFKFSAEQKDVPSFNFGSTSKPFDTGASKPAFSFGTVTPSEKPTAPLFGGERPSTPSFGAVKATTPSFSTATTAAPSFGTEKPTTPAFGGPASVFGEKKEAPKFDFSSASKAPFSFGNTEKPKMDTHATVFGTTTPSGEKTGPSFGTTTPAFGKQDPSLVFGKPADPAQVFGGHTNTPFSFGGSVPQSTFNFGQNSATSTPAFSKSTTPQFAFSGNQSNGAIQAPQPSFGQNPGQAQAGGFGFGQREATPTGVFGAGNAFGVANSGRNSREATPPAFTFGGVASMPNMANLPGAAGYTPPVMRPNRKLAQPRRRR